MRLLAKILFALLLVFLQDTFGQDAELSNLRSGISVIPGIGDGSDKRSAYMEEYFFFDKQLDDTKVIYVKGSTPIALIHNATNKVYTTGGSSPSPNYTLGDTGPDGLQNSGDEGIIRYRIDRDRQIKGRWVAVFAGETSVLFPAYTNPFTLDSQQYGFGDAVNVVGSTGSSGGVETDYTSNYFRGTLDEFGDEWHTLAYADDSTAVAPILGYYPELKDRADDGKTVLLVVNPKTPCFTARVTGTGQFFTTRPKLYFSPRVVRQTTYIAPGASGTISIELCDINGNNVFYRIGGSGAFTDAGAATVTIPDTAFVDGTNTLEYYYAGNAAYTKTRTVVKNPGYPSDAETHGYALFRSPSAYADMITRATTVGTLAYTKMNSYRTNSGFAGSGHDFHFAGYRTGKRIGSGHGSEQNALKNALVAKINGWGWTKSGEPRSYGQVAKEMLMDSVLQMDPIGLELNINGHAVPNRERYYRGYWDAEPVMIQLLSYDIMIANFKASQVTGGITAIEDHYIREAFARYAYAGCQLSMMGGGGYEAPGMWVGSQMTVGAFIALIMPEFSSLVCGSSGVGSIQTTYPDCPFPNHQYTWAQVLLETQPHTGFPGIKWGTGWVDNDATQDSLILDGTVMNGTYTLPYASWAVKFAYLSQDQMGQYAMLYAHLTRQLAPQYSRQRIRDFIQLGAEGNLYARYIPTDPDPGYTVETQPPSHRVWLYLLNDSWPEIAALNTSWAQSTGRDASAFTALAIPLYDPNYYGGADVTAPTLATVTIPSGGTTTVLTYSEPTTGNAGFTYSLSGGPLTTTYVSGESSATRVYSNSRTVGSGESGTLNYSAGDVQDPTGNALATITSRVITIIGAGDLTPPTVSITTPSGNVTVTSPNYTAMAGPAADNTGVQSVLWSNSRGGSGTATGTTAWTIPTITLLSGENIIAVQSRDAAGNLSTAATRTITYNPPSSGSTETHTNPRNRALLGF